MTRNAQHGAAYVELAMLLPLIIFLIYSAIELSSIIKTQQIVALLSRDAANNAFRKCADEATQAAVLTCLTSEKNDLLSKAVPVYGNFDLILGVYRLETPTGSVYANTGSTLNSTRFPQTRFVAADDLSPLVVKQRVIATSEVFYTYNALIPWVGSLVNQSGKVLYEATLF